MNCDHIGLLLPGQLPQLRLCGLQRLATLLRGHDAGGRHHRVVEAEDPDPADVDHPPVDGGHPLRGRYGATVGGRVVVAGDEVVRHPEVVEQIAEGFLEREPERRRVTGVDDGIHRERLREVACEVHPDRVQVDVRHVQDRHVAATTGDVGGDAGRVEVRESLRQHIDPGIDTAGGSGCDRLQQWPPESQRSVIGGLLEASRVVTGERREQHHRHRCEGQPATTEYQAGPAAREHRRRETPDDS